jgi:type II secretory pathway component PulC
VVLLTLIRILDGFWVAYSMAASLILAAAIFFIILSVSNSRNAGKALTAKTAVSTQEVQYKPIPRIETKSKETAVSEVRTVVKAPGAQYPELVLNGIMYLEIGPCAIINDAIVEEGDIVKGARVTKINKKSVVLEYNNVEITLSLK